jgi:hypothetical protein
MKKTYKLDLKDGIYIDVTGESLHVELGESDTEKGRVPSIRITGVDKDSITGEKSLVILLSEEPRLINICMMLVHCEYIGEL